MLTDAWKQDVEDRLHFQKDQKKNCKQFILYIYNYCVQFSYVTYAYVVTSNKGNRWSLITIRMG